MLRCLSSSARCCSSARASGSSASSRFPKPRLASAVLVIVGGPQYRAGAHRQFVQLARRLAAAGFRRCASTIAAWATARAPRGRSRNAAPISRRRSTRCERIVPASSACRAVGLVRCGVRRARLLAFGARSARRRDGAPQSVGTLGDDAREGAHQALLRAAARLEGILVEALLGRLRAGRSARRVRAQRRDARLSASATRCPAARRKRSRTGWPPGCGPFRAPCS